jgi:hypothetical protein
MPRQCQSGCVCSASAAATSGSGGGEGGVVGGDERFFRLKISHLV